MLKFKIKTKGVITQGIAENANSSYSSAGLIGHTGIDWVRGYGQPVSTDNAGFAYKVFNPQERADNWTAVYILVPMDNEDMFMEICLGHFLDVLVKEGDDLFEGQLIGKEGNFGTVFSGGVRITPEMQDAGDKRGSHVHEQYRPVRRVKKTERKEYYLEDKRGRKYKDDDGYYYHIVNKNNGLNGCINPRAYDYDEKREALESLYRQVLIRIIELLRAKLNK